MLKMVVIGAGSTVFTKRLVGDLLTFKELALDKISLVDIDQNKLSIIKRIVEKMCKQKNKEIEVEATTEISAGGIEAYLNDLEIPDKYGINQNVADTLGPGGIFRGLRVIPEILNICRDMEELCPEALLFNYSNPMAVTCMVLNRATDIRVYGLCHSVQGTAHQLASYLQVPFETVDYWCAGINHMAWFLEFKAGGKDMYPELKRLSLNQKLIDMLSEYEEDYARIGVEVVDTVRFEILKHFGYFVTESPFHMSEYTPYFRKSTDQINDLKIEKRWWLTHERNSTRYFEELIEILKSGRDIEFHKSYEYAPDIIRAIEKGILFRANINVPNTGLITNLPEGCCVEVPCLVDATGVHPCYIGGLPEQCAALNRTNINVQEMIAKAVLEKKKEFIYQAVKLDPLTASLLDLDQITRMTDELIAVNEQYISGYK